MDDLVTLCLLGVFILVGLMLLPRLMRGFSTPTTTRHGGESPRYDDPNISSRGGFGRDRGTRSSAPSRTERTDRPRHDDPDIESRGGFGRSQD